MIRRPLFAAALAGMFAGFAAMLLATPLLAVVFGFVGKPPLGLAALAGGISAMLWRRRGGFVLDAALLTLLTLGAPFGAPPFSAPWANAVGLCFYAVCARAMINHILAGLPRKTFGRYILEKHLLRLARLAGFVFFGLIVSAPFLIMLMTSLKSQQALVLNPLDFAPPLDPDALLRSYRELFSDYHFGVFMANTALVSAAVVFLTLALTVPGAYAMARLRFRGKRALSRSVLLIYLVPAIVLVIPLYAAFSFLGIRNSFWGLLIAYPATTIPAALYMLQGYFRALPAELEEAGLMDGLSRARVIWKITLPLAAPALASVALYVFMIAWNEFLFAFMFIDDPALFTLSRGVVSLNSSEVPRQHLMAGAVVATAPVLILFLALERFLIQGLAAGGVKG